MLSSRAVWMCLAAPPLALLLGGCRATRHAAATTTAANPDAAPACIGSGAIRVPLAWDPTLIPEATCEGDPDAMPPPAYSVSHPLGYYDGDVVRPLTAYLTFDDGPTDWTTDFLDILAAKGVKATFFVNAKNTKKNGLDGYYLDDANDPNSRVYYRDVLRREVDEGHVLGNHTVDHADLTELPVEQVASELDDNVALLNQGLLEAGGVPVTIHFIRPPYSRPWEYPDSQPDDYDQTIARVGSLFTLRGLNVFFNLDSTDSDDGAQGESYLRNPPSPPPVDPTAPTWDEKVARIQSTILQSDFVAQGKGMVIVFHDTHPTTRDALPDIIDGLRSQGYDFGTMEDYALWRWGRASADLLPGPALYSACVPEQDWGCESFEVPVGTDRSHEVCGRMWLAFQAAGGVEVIGEPRGGPQRSPLTGVIAQPFDRAVLELRPSDPPSCEFDLASPFDGGP